jgi:hypothetical protein
VQAGDGGGAGAATAGSSGSAGRPSAAAGNGYFDDPFPNGGTPSFGGTSGRPGSDSAGDGELIVGGFGTCFVVDNDRAGCPDGSFDDDADPSTACKTWAPDCLPGSYESSTPSAHSDRVCTPCASGRFSSGKNALSCVEWATCQAGSTELSPGSAVKDRACSCLNGGAAVVLPNGVATCECPAGTWGTSCALTTKRLVSTRCALKSDDRPVCWIGNVPSSFAQDTYTQFDGPCGIRSDGTLRCYDSDFGPSVPPSGTFLSLSVNWVACAIRTDHTLACWGTPPNSALLAAPSGTFNSVAMGSSIACGVRTNGQLACWSDDIYGNFVKRMPSGPFASVSVAGSGRACATRSNGLDLLGAERRRRGVGSGPGEPRLGCFAL